MVHFPPPPNPWQMMTFLNPLDALIPKMPFSFFAEFWVRVTSRAQGSVSVGFWGGGGGFQLSPFQGGSSQRAVLTPPPQLKAHQPCVHNTCALERVWGARSIDQWPLSLASCPPPAFALPRHASALLPPQAIETSLAEQKPQPPFTHIELKVHPTALPCLPSPVPKCPGGQPPSFFHKFFSVLKTVFSQVFFSFENSFFTSFSQSPNSF